MMIVSGGSALNGPVAGRNRVGRSAITARTIEGSRCTGMTKMPTANTARSGSASATPSEGSDTTRRSPKIVAVVKTTARANSPQ